MDLRIDVDPRELHPGEAVRGTLMLGGDGEVRGLRARLVLREISPDEAPPAYSEDRWRTEWQTVAGPGRPPLAADFALALPPDAVPNPLGPEGPVRWEVEAVADRARRADHTARAAVPIVADGKVRSPRREEPVSGRRRPRHSRRHLRWRGPGSVAMGWVLSLAFIAVYPAALGVVGLAGGFSSDDPPEFFWLLVGWGVALLGVAGLIWLIWVRRVRPPRWRGLRLSVEPARLRRGEELSVELAGSDRAATATSPVVVLELLEFADRPRQLIRIGSVGFGDETRQTTSSVIWSREHPIEGGDATAAIEVPAELPFSYAGSCRSYLWRVVARAAPADGGRIRGRPPAEREQRLWVDP